MNTPASATVDRMLDAMIGDESRPPVAWTGVGSLPSVFPVTEFASASIAAVGAAVSGLIALHGRAAPAVTVDRRLASLWFAGSLRPEGWTPPPPWDPVAGDYRTADGWIRLHTNANAHRQAALGVLDVPAHRERVAAAVTAWQATDLESAVVDAGGCAAAMRTIDEWDAGEPGVAVAAEPLVAWTLTGAGRRPGPRPTPARLLVDSAVASDRKDPEPVDPARSGDLSSSMELTTRGSARRVRMPLNLDGVEFGVDLPARDLGGDEPVWATAAKA